ncbi:erythromycin esterase family protein [Streptomyces sp. TLI_105]|uniref:erythromycin esterase family protein n=1 Tax=Streptomyces sp. TLI_105 TaxID=1881019 RepID=UPI00089B32ED|nr:erythromycin esterase family protein [Streptomyces sp. TLI_105]SEE22133.1 erythromycin esterase [Streptomyces sp. TLI_105]
MYGYRKRTGRRGVLALTGVVAATTLATAVASAAPVVQAVPTAPDASAVSTDPLAASAVPADLVAAGQDAAVVRSLERVAHPLRATDPGGRTADLRALSSMVGDAKVVGLGEATHGSHEFFAMKERTFRHLVEERGFTTFALEMSWSAGLRIDEYLQGGPGDPRQIAEATLAGSPWEREEFVSLIGWMREHNRRHPDHRVHFMGDDLGAPKLGDPIFERVLSSVRQTRPEALPRLTELYTALRPFEDMFAYLRKPVTERQGNAARAQEALDLVADHQEDGGDDYAWTVQHARNIAQTFAFATVDLADPASVTAAERLRDQAMADNVLWWHRHTGHRMLLSAHNGHIGYLSTHPDTYPRTQGAVLRGRLGRDYVAIGFSFAAGSFLTKDTSLEGDWNPLTVPAARAGMNEHTLDRVRYRDFYLDLRTAPAAARAWLDRARPVYDAGSTFTPDPLPTLALGRAYDILIHLHRVRAADKLAPPPYEPAG